MLWIDTLPCDICCTHDQIIYQTSDICLVTHHDISYLFTVILLVFYLHAYSGYCYLVVCLSCYLVILCLQLSCCYFMHIVYMHEYSSLHTNSLGRFLTTLNSYVQILDALFLLFRCSMILDALFLLFRCSMRPYVSEELESLYWFRYSQLSCLPVISLFSIYQIQLLFHFFIYMISCVDAYMWYWSNHVPL